MSALRSRRRVRVKLSDLSLQDTVATTVAEQITEVSHQVPVPFELVYDPDEIRQGRSFSVRATIYQGDEMLLTTDCVHTVLTGGQGSHVDLIPIRVGR